MLMDDKEKLQIYVTYTDGAMQSWGYDGWGFKSYDDMLADVAKDFPDDFPTRYTNVEAMLLVWGHGLPLGDQLKDVPTKELEPTYGQELLAVLNDWLNGLGVLTNGS